MLKDTKLEATLIAKNEQNIRVAVLPGILGSVAWLTGYTVGLLEVLDADIDLEDGLPDEEPLPDTSGLGSGGNHNHHCHPQAYGGSNDRSNISQITVREHQRLHSLMQARFKEIIDAMTGRSMATSGGRTGRDVLSDFGSQRVKEELEKFYRDFPEFGC